MEFTKISEQIKKLYAPDYTLIIGIDGLGGAGKSTISEELCDLLNKENYNVAILHIDDFIYPKAIRYNDNYAEWECYYNLQWRYDYLVNEILNPIKCGTDFKDEIELYNKDNDSYLLSEINVPVGSIVIVEGVFLQRQELKGIFDYMIYIDIPENIRFNRVLERDRYIGNKQQIKSKYENRYFPAEHYYTELCSPSENADYIIPMSEIVTDAEKIHRN